MTNPLSKSSLRAAIAMTTAIVALLMVQPLHAQKYYYGKQPPGVTKSRAARSSVRRGSASRSARKVQYDASMVELPSAAYQGSGVVPPASEMMVPAIEGVVPSYEVPVMESPADGMYPEYPGDNYVENAPYEQGSQYQTQDQAAPIYSTGTWYNNGDWFASADMVWLHRDTPEPAPFVTDGLVGQSFAINELLALDFAPGTRLTFGSFLGRDAANRDYTLDFTYLGGFSWDETASLISREGGQLDTALTPAVTGALDTDDPILPFFGTDRHDIRFESDLNSFELNYRIRTRPGRDQLAMQPDGRWVRHGVGSQMRSFLAGFRFLSLSETQTITATTAGSETTTTTTHINGDPTVTVNSAVASDLVRGIYSVDTSNDMFGFQVGGELTEKYDEWSWGLRGKVGGLLNFASRQNLVNSRIRNASIETTMVPAVDADGNALFDAGGNTYVFDDPATTVDETARLTRAMDTQVTTTQVATDVQASGADDAEKMTFLAEVGLFGTYQIRPNLHFKAAYDFMLLAGVATAPQNGSLRNGFGGFNIGSSAFYHGGSFGFETTW